MVLDAANLDAIVQEARSCFLYEDAPDYVAMLEQGMQRLFVAQAEDPSVLQGEYTDLMRATHSLKGGAGIAQLPSMHQLAHKLEDLLEALSQGRVPAQAQDSAYELLALSVEQIKDLIAVAASNRSSAIATDAEAANSLPIIVALDRFLQDLPQQSANSGNSFKDSAQVSAINPYILKTALEVDLEDCLQRVETLLQQRVQPKALQQGITNFIEECTLLGQTLNLSWLVNTADTVHKAVTQTNYPLENIAKTAVSQMRQL